MMRRWGLWSWALVMGAALTACETEKPPPQKVLRRVRYQTVALTSQNRGRRNRLKTVTVEAGLEPGYTAAETNAVLQPWLREQQKQWPLGYSWSFGGEAETSGKANESIGAKLPIAGLIIVLLLVGQFNSIRRPMIILLTIPLGMIGVVIGLLITKDHKLNNSTRIAFERWNSVVPPW